MIGAQISLLFVGLDHCVRALIDANNGAALLEAMARGAKPQYDDIFETGSILR